MQTKAGIAVASLTAALALGWSAVASAENNPSLDAYVAQAEMVESIEFPLPPPRPVGAVAAPSRQVRVAQIARVAEPAREPVRRTSTIWLSMGFGF